MARPHIMFIQAQALPWRRGLYGGGRKDVRVKVLSIDTKNGDSTCIIRYPAGSNRPRPRSGSSPSMRPSTTSSTSNAIWSPAEHSANSAATR